MKSGHLAEGSMGSSHCQRPMVLEVRLGTTDDAAVTRVLEVPTSAETSLASVKWERSAM